MTSPNRIAQIGALVGDPARAAILATLMDGRAFSAGELARAAGITPQTASAHLAELKQAGLLAMERQGKHRYHRLASADIARMLEGMMQIATARDGISPPVTGPRNAVMKHARTCYDHFAGALGMAITNALLRERAIIFEAETGQITPSGMVFLRTIGIDPRTADGRGKRPACKPCLDWSERRPHVAGQLGAIICDHFLAQRYVRRIEPARTVEVTRKGNQFLREMLDIRDPL